MNEKKNLSGQYELFSSAVSVTRVYQPTDFNTNLNDETSLKPGNIYY